MASDPHGLFSSSLPHQLISATNTLPLSSSALQKDTLESSSSSKDTTNRTPLDRQEQLTTLIESSNSLSPHNTGAVETHIANTDSAALVMGGRPIITYASGQEERSMESVEAEKTEGLEKEEEAPWQEQAEASAERRPRGEQVDDLGEQVESSEKVREMDRADEGGETEDTAPVREGVGLELGEETEGSAKSEEDQGVRVKIGVSDLEKLQAGERKESAEARAVQTAKEGEGVEPKSHTEISATVSVGISEKQSRKDKVEREVDLPESHELDSSLPHVVYEPDHLNPETSDNEPGLKDVEHEMTGSHKAEDEEKEKAVKASSDPVEPDPTSDISSTSHIPPTSTPMSAGQMSTEKDDVLSAELPNSQESNGSLDILCSSPIGSQEGDKAADRLDEEVQFSENPALTKASDDTPEKDNTIATSLDNTDPGESAEEGEGTEPPLPRPSSSRFAQPAPVLANRTLKRKDTMQDLFSAMIPLKRKMVEFTREPAVLDQSDVEGASVVEEKEEEVSSEKKVDDDLLDAQHGEIVVEAEIRDEQPIIRVIDESAGDIKEDPKKGQWRVGRLPGHQGSHIKREGDGTSDSEDSGKRGQKRSLGQSINDSAERVLKKPFRFPARVVLKSAPPRPKTPPRTSSPLSSSPLPPDHKSSSPSRSRTQTSGPTRSKPSSRPFSVPRKIDFTPIKPSFPTRTSTPVLPPSHQSGSTTSTIRSSPSKSSPTFSKRLAKPFKTPFSRSTAPSPISSTSRIKTPSTRELIAELEKEERTLRQAIKYHTEPEEDERLVELISTWRDAGQQVAELLFTVYPRPDPDATNGGESNINKPFNMYQDDQSFFATSEYTPEQLRYIANLDTNADGDPVDNDGMPIFGNSGGGMAMDIEGVLEKRGKESDGDEADGKRTSKETDSTEWTIGTMLVKLGVDPEMYAWDADAEDWGKPEE